MLNRQMNKSRLKQTLPTVLMTTNARKYYIRDLARLVGKRITINFKEDINRVRRYPSEEYTELREYLEEHYQEILDEWTIVLLVTHCEELQECLKGHEDLEKDLENAFDLVVETRNGLIYLDRVKTTKKNEPDYDYFFDCFVDSVLIAFKNESIEKTMEDVKNELIDTLNKDLSKLTTRR